MGGILPRYSCCIPAKHNYNSCKENHSSTPRVKKGHRRNLSAAFNMSEVGAEMEIIPEQQFLNINTATEEELMTLPGINRQTARNIVDYRKQIIGYKKIEDIALVSGVGATRFNHIRLEISVSKKKGSQSSSASSSRNDLNVSTQDNISRTSKQSQSRLLPISRANVNSSNVFQLMKVKGLTQDLAQNIVAHRDKRGPYKSLDDLVKVKGIKPALLSAIRPNLVLRDETMSSSLLHPHANGSVPNSSHTNNVSTTSTSTNAHHTRQDSSGTSCSLLKGSQEDLISVYGPLLRKSFRNHKKPFIFRRNQRAVVRVASWNLQQCNNDKASNPGVREVVAMTVLENGLSLLAVQELGDKEALQQLCDELNRPTIPNVKKWVGHHGTWQCVTSDPSGRMFQGTEHLGFLFDTARGIELKSSCLLEKSSKRDKAFTRKPFVAVFKVQEWDVVLVNVHLKATGFKNEDRDRLEAEVNTLPEVLEALEEALPGEHDVILLGDFNLEPSAEDFCSLRNKDYKNALSSDLYTNISNKNPEGSHCYDNLWMSPETQRVHTGNTEVVREGLTSPWIPDGWGWGGVVSDHCPIWTEFYVDEDFDSAYITRGIEAIKLAGKTGSA